MLTGKEVSTIRKALKSDHVEAPYKSTQVIADELGFSVFQVDYVKRLFDYKSGKRRFQKISEDEWYKMYITKNMTMAQIASKLACSSRTVQRYLQKHNIIKDEAAINHSRHNKEMILKK